MKKQLLYLVRWAAMLVAVLSAVAAIPARAADNICTFSGDLFTSPVDFGTIASRPATINMARDSSRVAGQNITVALTRRVTINCPPVTSSQTGATGYRIRMRVANPLPGTSTGDIRLASGVALKISQAGSVSQKITQGGDFMWRADIPRNGGVVTDTVAFQLVVGNGLPAAGPFNSAGAFVIYADTATTGNTGPVVTSPDSPLATNSQGTVALPTCLADNAMVQMPLVSPGDLAPIGTLAGSTPFSIVLHCARGYADLPVRLFMTLTDSTTPANRTKILSVATGPSAATGVGIQISTSNGTALAYGADSAVAGNAGQFNTNAVLPAAASGDVTIPFTASYIATGNGPVRGGAVNALATYTISYQ